MSIPRAKKSKKPKNPLLTLAQIKVFVKAEVHKAVRMANYLNIAIMVLNMNTLHGWGHKRIGAFLEAHLSLMSEIADGRMTTWELLKLVKDRTGYDIKELVDETYEDTK